MSAYVSSLPATAYPIVRRQRQQTKRLLSFKRWDVLVRHELTELAVFWAVFSIAVVRSEGSDLLYMHGNKTDLEGLKQAWSFL